MYHGVYELTACENHSKRDATRLVRRHTSREIIVARARLFVAVHYPEAWGRADAPVRQDLALLSGHQFEMTATWCRIPPDECSPPSSADAVALLRVGDKALSIFTQAGDFLEMSWLDGKECCEDLWIKALSMATS